MPLSTSQGSECLHYLKSQYNATLQEFVAVGIGLSDNPMGALMEVLQTLLECEQWGNGVKECIGHKVADLCDMSMAFFNPGRIPSIVAFS